MKPYVNLRAIIVVISTVILPFSAEARPLQIIHTNDLHSMFENAGRPGVGGYAALKTAIDQIKQKATQQGIETLVLDAGDFLEGSQLYLAGAGEHSWRMMNEMGYDAVTIGNHDWLMGDYVLDAILGYAPPKFAFLGANMIFDHSMKNLNKHIWPAAEFNKGGLKIAVLGFVTDEILYSWLFENSILVNPYETAQVYVPRLRKKNDAVIALSHMGLEKDMSLARKISGIDVIVGGHDHNILVKPVYVRSPNKRDVPIVQTGNHAFFVGDLLVDIEKGQPLQVLHYRLVPVTSKFEDDNKMAGLVKDARNQLEKDYGPDWLYEQVGYAEAPSDWSQLLVNAMLRAGKADLAIDIPDFTGIAKSEGPITREDLMSLYPRCSRLDHKFGWTVWTAKIRGWILKFAMKKVLEKGYEFGVSGLTYNLRMKNGKRIISNIRIGGKKIKWYKNYKIALPEGIAKASIQNEFTNIITFIIKSRRDSKIPVWTAIEKQIQAQGGIIK